jgi:hypothetical protein
MPLVTFEDRIAQARHIAKTFRGSPAQCHVAILNVLGIEVDSAEHLDALWAGYYNSETLSEIQAEVDALTAELRDHENQF